MGEGRGITVSAGLDDRASFTSVVYGSITYDGDDNLLDDLVEIL